MELTGGYARPRCPEHRHVCPLLDVAQANPPLEERVFERVATPEEERDHIIAPAIRDRCRLLDNATMFVDAITGKIETQI